MLRTMMNNMYVKMDEATDTNGGGGGGSSFLATSEGGSAAAAGTKDAGTSSGAAGDKSAANAAASAAASGGAAADWKSQLPAELQKNDSLSKFTSVEALAGSYVAAQKLIGADKVPVPGKHATEEDWTNFYKKVGLPESVDKYEVKFKESVSLDEEFTKEFKERAYKAGLLPQQAQKLAEWFSDVNLNSEAKVAQQINAKFKEGVASLQKEWGDGYQLKLARGIKVIEDHGGKEMIDHLNSLGVGGDMKLIKMLSTIGDKMYAEHKIVTATGEISKGRTPKEIDAEIKNLQAEPAYMDKSHPKHQTVLDDISALFKEKFPNVK